jgi:type II secretory pathway pseudopilin PulG
MRASVNSRHQLRGFTLLEAVIAAGILVLGIGMALALFVNVDQDVSDTLAITDLELRANRASLRIQHDVEELRSNTLTLSDNGSVPGNFTRAEYRPVTGYDGVAAAHILGPLRRVEFTLDPGETRNNLDDDGDGFIDEGELSHWVDTNGNGNLDAAERTVIATNVASEPEEYVAGLGTVGQSFVWSILPNGGTTVVGGDTHSHLTFTMLAKEPSTGNIMLREMNYDYTLRN